MKNIIKKSSIIKNILKNTYVRNAIKERLGICGSKWKEPMNHRIFKYNVWIKNVIMYSYSDLYLHENTTLVTFFINLYILIRYIH